MSPAIQRPRVVILGGTGFVGRHVLEELRAAGLPAVSYGSRALDLCQTSSASILEREIGSTDVVLFASAITPDKGRDRATMLRNLLMADTVCGFLERSRCAHLLYLSTDNVFAAEEEILDEGSRLDPIDLYGLGHLVRERLLADACRNAEVPFLVLRTSPVYGPGGSQESYGPGRFLRTACRDSAVTLFGGGEEVRHHLFVEDLARAVRLLVTARTTGVVHIAPPIGTSFREVAEIVRSLVGDHVRIESRLRQVPLRHRRHQPNRLPGAVTGLDFTPLAVGLARTLAAERQLVESGYLARET